jgi:protein-tyrosine phosphatase
MTTMSYVEVHFHLLPGVDDGPTSIEESLALAAAAVADGTRTVVATPHVRTEFVSDPTEVPVRVQELVDRLRRERIRLDVLPGGELALELVGSLTARQLEAIAHGPAGRRWLLLEAPFDGLEPGFTAAADELRERGFAVVVAHPERALRTRATLAALEHEVESGSALQLNAWSFAGLYGGRVRTEALRLLRWAPRAVIASDAHGEARMPALRLALGALAAAGERDPGRFAGAIPRALLEQGVAVRPAVVLA